MALHFLKYGLNYFAWADTAIIWLICALFFLFMIDGFSLFCR